MGKPHAWDKLSDRERKETAAELINSPRGQYIVSQALYYGIKALRAVPEPHREVSNMEDMEILQEELFAKFALVIGLEDQFREAQKAKAKS